MTNRRSPNARPLSVTADLPPMHETFSRRAALRTLGRVLYAARLADGVIKIGCTGNLYRRLHQLGTKDLLAFMPHGDFEDEALIHAGLVEHRAYAHEYYFPTTEVLDVVNRMRDRIGLAPIAGTSTSAPRASRPGRSSCRRR